MTTLRAPFDVFETAQEPEPMPREFYSDEQELVDCLTDAIQEIHEQAPYLLSLTLANINRLANQVMAAWLDDAAELSDR